MFKVAIFLCCWTIGLARGSAECSGQRCSLDINCGAAPKNCPQTKYLFPNNNQVTDYIRVKAPFQTTSKLTICAWLTPDSGLLKNTGFFSYATPSSDNALVLFFDGSGKYKPHIGKESQSLALFVTKRTHICTVISKPNVMVYANGVWKGTLTYSDSNPFQGGGSIIVGQEQDKVLGDYDPNQALTGTVENLMLWYRVLTHEEIMDLYMEQCNCPKDYGLALTPDVVQLHGRVLAQPVDQC